MAGEIPILGQKAEEEQAAAIQRATEYAMMLANAWDAHDSVRKETMAQMRAALDEASKEDGAPVNGIWLAIKELELATHSSTMTNITAAFAQLAVAGVAVPMPADPRLLEMEEGTTQQ